MLGYVFVALGFFLFSKVTSLRHVFYLQALIGIGEALYAPAFDVLYAETSQKKNPGKAWGTWEAMNYFSSAVSALLGGVIVTVFGFEILFITMSLLCGVSGLLTFFRVRT